MKQNNRRMLVGVAGLAALLVTGGCASVEGMQRPVLDPKIVLQQARALPPQVALQQIAVAPDKRAYRNYVIAIHMAANESQYKTFRRYIANDAKGTHLVADFAVLGLNGVGAVAKKAAHKLSAAAAVIAGGYAAFDREVYFQKALPALLASMDAARFRAKADIMRHLGDDIDRYPLELAFLDLIHLDLVATLDDAIDRVTAAASADREAAEDSYNRINFNPCLTLDQSASLQRRELIDALRAAAYEKHDKAEFDRLTKAIGSKRTPGTTEEDFDAQFLAAVTAIEQDYCAPETINALRAKIGPL